MRPLRTSRKVLMWRIGFKVGLLGLYLTLLLGVGGLAQLGMASIAIIPPQPTTADEITILLGGTWPNSCVPSSPEVTITGNEILIETSYPSAICLQVLTDWSLEVPIGRLPAGAYTVTVTYQQPGLPPKTIGSAYFTVNPVMIRLPDEADLVIYGPEEARIGHAMLVGDFNDDGRPDLVIGQNCIGWPQRAYIIWGREQLPGEIDLASLGEGEGKEGVTTLEGVIADTLTTGDINGDGLQDLIIGDTLAEGGAGAVYALLGGPELAQTASLKIEEAADLTVYGVRPIRPFDIPGDSLGFAVAVGDLDNDRFDDLAVSAPFTMRWDRQEFHAGAVYLFFGREEPPRYVHIVQGEQDASIFAAQGSPDWMTPGDLLGQALAIADLNEDGFKDLVVRAPGPEEVLVFWGREREGWPRVIDLARVEPDAVITGIEPSWTGGGMDLTAVHEGDFNGDGSPDLLVTQPGQDRALLFFGPWHKARSAEEGDVVITGAQGSAFGYVAAVGDLNGDGLADLLIGAPRDERVYGFLGRRDWPARLDVKEEEEGADLILEGAATFEFVPLPATHVPRTLAAQDLNGDGIDDILIGDPQGRGPGEGRLSAGRVYVVFGRKA